MFYVDELVKQSRPGRVGCKLELPAYPPDRRLCVVTYLRKYIDMTKHVRKEEKALLISYKKPYKKVTVQTVSRWIKSTLHAAGIDTYLRLTYPAVGVTVGAPQKILQSFSSIPLCPQPLLLSFPAPYPSIRVCCPPIFSSVFLLLFSLVQCLAV